MIIQMDNVSDNPTRERVQHLLKQNVELENKRRKAMQARIPSDPNAWQRMRENFEAILLEDHGFSEQYDIEYALWQLHYKRIEELRALFSAAVASAGSTPSHNGKSLPRGGPDRAAKIRSQFKTFLTEATGFYHDLILKIRAKYGLPLGNFSDDSEGQILLSQDVNRSVEVKKGMISCHRCFIYLGDLARYKGLYGEGKSKSLDFATASSYYMKAASLWPSSGNPHHQLSILASYLGDELNSIYRYFRSLAVDSPFTTARENLIIAFEKNRQNYSQLSGDWKASTTKSGSVPTTLRGKGKGNTRFSTKDKQAEGSSVRDRSSDISEILKLFKIRFVRLNGILFTRTSLETFGEVFSMVRSDFLELLSSGPDEEYSFGSDAVDCRLTIVRLIAILVFTIHNVNKETESQSYSEILQRSVLLQCAFTASFEFMGLIFERCSQLKDPSASYLLPGIMVFLEWLVCHQNMAVGNQPDDKEASARLFCWKHCVTFFNKMISCGYMFVDEDEGETCFVNMSRYDESETANLLALSEDFELRGFLPLLPAQVILDFFRKPSYRSDEMKEKRVRIQRVIAAGKALANVVRVGGESFYLDKKLKKFLVGVEPQFPDDDLLGTSQNASLGSVEVDNPVMGPMTLGVLPKPQSCGAIEEEDEVIVFKPPMVEKRMDWTVSKPHSTDFFAANVNEAKVNVKDVGVAFSGGFDGYLTQNGFNLGSSQAMPVVKTDMHDMQPLQPSTTVQMTEPGTLVNGLAHMKLWEDGLSEKSENFAGSFHPHPLPVSLPKPAYIGNGFNYSVSVPQDVVPSKFDLIMSQGVDSLSIKASPVTAAGLKNPVTRPLRHLGPPPGFGLLPSKTAHVSKMDDCSWLDDYWLPAVGTNVGLNSSFNHSGQPYHNTNKSKNSINTANFPFPGKQVSSLQPALENLKDWQDVQFSERRKLFQDEVHQFHQGNQQSAVIAQQYQGQSIWEGGLFG